MAIEARLLRSLIQGGMGLRISGHDLAHAVSRHKSGQALGTVSITGIERVLAWTLQWGDQAGLVAEAFNRFPLPDMAQRVWKRYFKKVPPSGKALCNVPRWTLEQNRELEELTILAGFCEVYWAKRGKNIPIAANFLYKVQMPLMAVVFGAMLAGVDMIIMGAGIPRDVPHIMNHLATWQSVQMTIDAHPNSSVKSFIKEFDPKHYLDGKRSFEINRPPFVAIVSLETLAEYLMRKADVPPDGLVVEHHSAGGHNAPPRNKALGYSDRDEPNLAKIADLGVPAWLAGSRGGPDSIAEAQKLDFVGVQAGTPFALCQESGMRPDLKANALAMAKAGELRVVTTDVSPTSFPFKVANIADTVFESAVYEARGRVCEMGELIVPIADKGGKVRYLCAAEPEGAYCNKGGDLEDTVGKTCLCCNLYATAGFVQTYPRGGVEPPIVTLGDISHLPEIIERYGLNYGAHDVCDYLLGV